MIHKDLKAFNAWITLKVSEGAVIAEMEMCYDFTLCAKFKQTKPPKKIGRMVRFHFKKVSGTQLVMDEPWVTITFSADGRTYTGNWSGWNIEGKRLSQATPTQAVSKDEDSDESEESSNR